MTGFGPGSPEAAVGATGGTDVRFVHAEIEVCDPVFWGLGAAERYDDEFVGVVYGDIACYIC